MRHRISELFAGAGLFLRGFGTWAKSPGLMAMGAVPALIVGTLMLALVIILSFQVGGWAAALTPFANGWDPVWADLLRVALSLGLLVGVIVLCVLTFAAVTLAVGDPFYERISRSVDQRLGGDHEAPELGFWGSVRKGLRDAVVLIGMAIGTGLVVFVVGLIPLVGTALGLTLGAILGGRALARELTGYAGDARGLSLADRRVLLRTRSWRTMGFGIVAYLLLLIPGVAVIATPVAIVGATLLVRDLRGEPTTAPTAAPTSAPPAAPPAAPGTP
ncbi:EI24 domain-containing protein [Agrococcus sp. ARC_14]|uniref:EI24 domain-containing protein n=1 Tax=Agrococcus sp. ARC_14 TaxID=2919927 RepID=UPI001F06B11C|nr:EI24 domain-containing protein [Agrococcus sp. ARC_14]MCH1883324.1 EI24 domain-containing protein [Agrococcus sp. ARC_14]